MRQLRCKWLSREVVSTELHATHIVAIDNNFLEQGSLCDIVLLLADKQPTNVLTELAGADVSQNVRKNLIGKRQECHYHMNTANTTEK